MQRTLNSVVLNPRNLDFIVHSCPFDKFLMTAFHLLIKMDLTFRPLSTSHCPLADSVNHDQTGKNVQSDFGSTTSKIEDFFLISKLKKKKKKKKKTKPNSDFYHRKIRASYFAT